MQKEFIWILFEKTGNIDLYLYYKKYKEIINKYEEINFQNYKEITKEISLR